ncbi:response regulator transcription factor [Achromobacter sp. AGC25]
MKAAPLIAVVDDDASVRKALGSLLRSLDLNVVLYDGAAGLLNADDLSRLSCVVTDIQMPGMTGLAMCAALRERGLSVPVVLMTAFPEERYREQARQLGAFCFLCKPFEDAEILRCIDRAIHPDSTAA